MRRLLSLALLVLSISPLPAAKEALLIANAAYSHLGKLPNPVPDARQLADVLRRIGFNVSILENASREDMLLALGDFEERLRSNQGIAFFHYGGHGMQVDGKNFLIPADADIPDEKRVATRAVDVDEVMSALDASGAAANVVVLDACRDNPLPATSTRSAARGLSVVARKPKNSIIIYAAEADNRALDGLFTPVLAQAIAESGNRDISEVMKQVRKEVFTRSDGAQTPGEYNQLFDPLILSEDRLSGESPPQDFATIPAVVPQVRTEVLPTVAPDTDNVENIDEVASYWKHNGSVVGLIPKGNERTFIYIDPRAGLAETVRPGTVLFTGTSDGKSYRGVARRFRKGMPPNLYPVSGPILGGGNKVVLKGLVTIRDNEGHQDKTFEDVLVFDLIRAIK